MINITFSGETAADIQASINSYAAWVRGETRKNSAQLEVAENTSSSASDQPSVLIPAAESGTLTPAPTEETGIPAPAQSEGAAILTYKEHLAPTFAKLLEVKGAPFVAKLLATFGAKNGPTLAPDKLVAALAAAKEALGE